MDKVCLKCGFEKPIGKFYARTVKNVVYFDNMCISCRGKAQRAMLRLRLIETFGGKCACCGETHPLLLTLDHVQGGGKQEYQNKRTHQIWLRAIKVGPNTGEFQLLCMTCNFAKGQYGVCPHQSGLTPQQAFSDLKKQAEGIGYEHINWNSKGWFKPKEALQ